MTGSDRTRPTVADRKERGPSASLPGPCSAAGPGRPLLSRPWFPGRGDSKAPSGPAGPSPSQDTASGTHTLTRAFLIESQPVPLGNADA